MASIIQFLGVIAYIVLVLIVAGLIEKLVDAYNAKQKIIEQPRIMKRDFKSCDKLRKAKIYEFRRSK